MHYEDMVIWTSTPGFLIKQWHTVKSVSSMTVGALCQCDSWSLATSQTAAVCLSPPEFVLKAFYGESHKSLHAAFDCWNILGFFFLSVRSKIKETKKNHLILFAFNWNSKLGISCSHFPKVIANWCELLSSLHLAAAQAAQTIWLWTAPWSLACVNHPDCSSLYVAWEFSQWRTHPPCTIAARTQDRQSSDTAAVMNHAGCLCVCSLWMFSCSLSPLPPPYWCYQAQ